MTVAARSLKRTLHAAAAPVQDTGIVTAIVAVTGHEDSVKDIIVPGAFTDTFKKMRAKLCWHHDWKDPLGRVLSIVEVRPGDKRLPARTPDGRPWPKEAGAVIATMQFNLRTTRGRDMYEHCKLWAERGEAAFSIGYRVVDGMASKRADGVRLIYRLDLFEVSLVLHGAHNMALALEVKDLGIDGFELKDAGLGGVLEVKAAEPMIGNGAMVALYLPSEAAAAVAQPDGNPADELHVTLAFLGGQDAADAITDPSGLADTLAMATAGTGPLSGTIGGIGTFPPGENGHPVWVPVDVPGLTELRQSLVGALDAAGYPQQSEHGYTPHVTLGYDLPSIEPVAPVPVTFDTAYLVIGGDRYPLPLAADAPAPAPMEGKAAQAVAEAIALGLAMEVKSGAPGVADTPSDRAAVARLRKAWVDGTVAAEIGWGTPGDFDRCVALATEHMSAEDAKGWCNLRHHDALGMYPATHAKLERKSAAAAVLEAKTMFGGSAGAATVPSLGTPQKVSGSTTRAKKRRTPQEGLETKMMPQMRGSYEERREALSRALDALFRKSRQDTTGMDDPAETWVCIEATFDDTVVAVVTERSVSQAYQLPYTWEGGEVSLGVPVKVDLDVVAVPDEDGAEAEKVEEGEAVQVRFIDPTAAALSDATRRLSSMPEGKSLDELEEPLLRLMDALAVKGFDVAKAVLGDDEEADPAEAEPDSDADDETAEVVPDDNADEDDTVTLDPEDVRKQMDELRA